jgi:hypothetical protein
MIWIKFVSIDNYGLELKLWKSRRSGGFVGCTTSVSELQL